MPELEIRLVDGGELNFNQSFLKFNVQKKIQAKRFLDLTLNTEYQTLLAQAKVVTANNNANNFTIAFLSEKYNFFKKNVYYVRHTSLPFTQVKLCKGPEVILNYLTFLNNKTY